MFGMTDSQATAVTIGLGDDCDYTAGGSGDDGDDTQRTEPQKAQKARNMDLEAYETPPKKKLRSAVSDPYPAVPVTEPVDRHRFYKCPECSFLTWRNVDQFSCPACWDAHGEIVGMSLAIWTVGPAPEQTTAA